MKSQIVLLCNLHMAFLLWWVNTTDSWTYQELVVWFVKVCRDICPAAHAAGVLKRYFKDLDTTMLLDSLQIAA